MSDLIHICIDKEIVDKVHIIKKKTGLSEGNVLLMVLDYFLEGSLK